MYMKIEGKERSFFNLKCVNSVYGDKKIIEVYNNITQLEKFEIMCVLFGFTKVKGINQDNILLDQYKDDYIPYETDMDVLNGYINVFMEYFYNMEVVLSEHTDDQDLIKAVCTKLISMYPEEINKINKMIYEPFDYLVENSIEREINLIGAAIQINSRESNFEAVAKLKNLKLKITCKDYIKAYTENFINNYSNYFIKTFALYSTQYEYVKNIVQTSTSNDKLFEEIKNMAITFVEPKEDVVQKFSEGLKTAMIEKAERLLIDISSLDFENDHNFRNYAVGRINKVSNDIDMVKYINVIRENPLFAYEGKHNIKGSIVPMIRISTIDNIEPKLIIDIFDNQAVLSVLQEKAFNEPVTPQVVEPVSVDNTSPKVITESTLFGGLIPKL